MKLYQVHIGFVEVGGKGLLFGLGQCCSIAQLAEAMYDMFQSVWDVQFKGRVLVMIRGIVGMGLSKVLATDSF